MNDDAKTDATPSWYRPPAAAPPAPAPPAAASRATPAADAPAANAPAANAPAASVPGDGWPAAPAADGWPSPAAVPPVAFTHLSNDSPAPQPGFTHLSNDSPAPQPGFTHLSNDAPAPQPSFTHLSNDAPALQPTFMHLSNDSPAPKPDFTPLANGAPPAAVPATTAPASSLGTALSPPTPLVRPVPLPRPEAAVPHPEFVDVLPQIAPPLTQPATPSAPQPAPQPAYDPFHHEESSAVVDEDGGGPGWHVRAAAPAGVASPLGLTGATSADLAAASAAGMPWNAKPKPSPLRRYMLLGVGLFALCGLTALVLTNVNRGVRSIQQPSTIGTLTQVDAPGVAPTLQSLDHFERSIGATNVVTAIYGNDGQPQMLLVVVQNPLLSGGGTPAALQNFMRGLTSGAGSVGWVLDPTKATTTSVSGTTFACNSGPASGLGGTVLSTCAWTDPGVAGAVIDVTGQSQTDTLNETVLARAAAVR